MAAKVGRVSENVGEGASSSGAGGAADVEATDAWLSRMMAFAASFGAPFAIFIMMVVVKAAPLLFRAYQDHR